jgi:hypothetical protein
LVIDLALVFNLTCYTSDVVNDSFRYVSVEIEGDDDYMEPTDLGYLIQFRAYFF